MNFTKEFPDIINPVPITAEEILERCFGESDLESGFFFILLTADRRKKVWKNI